MTESPNHLEGELLQASFQSFFNALAKEASASMKNEMLREINAIREEEQEKLKKIDGETYMTRQEVMSILRRSYSTLVKWKRCGYLVPIKFGNKNLYRKSDVLKLLERG